MDGIFITMTCFFDKLIQYRVIKKSAHIKMCRFFDSGFRENAVCLFFPLILSVVGGGKTHFSFKHQAEIIGIGKPAAFRNFR